ncbi:hypothetical protein CO046_04290 [Candidatus Peregrinibacteria bacterium CG_4_9_14_0_2_um_filter_53_11]|nr:MAG: hypothetical protein CO046_04290 [Candidatus Peregrinibacteria bacterium CG_4_9_14_0_2_um_filter_53_11]
MKKLYSELMGMSIFEEHSPHRPLGVVRNVMIDPETGKLLAFVLKNRQVILPADTECLNNALYIRSRDDLIPMEDVLRVAEVDRMAIDVAGSQVMTAKTRKILGRVIDYEVDLKAAQLTTLHVAKLFLIFHLSEAIISAKNIIKIDRAFITVEDTTELRLPVDDGDEEVTPSPLAV